MKNCPKCGEQNLDAESQCIKCGFNFHQSSHFTRIIPTIIAINVVLLVCVCVKYAGIFNNNTDFELPNETYQYSDFTADTNNSDLLSNESEIDIPNTESMLTDDDSPQGEEVKDIPIIDTVSEITGNTFGGIIESDGQVNKYRYTTSTSGKYNFSFDLSDANTYMRFNIYDEKNKNLESYKFSDGKNVSVTLEAYPSIFPSLYTLIVYVTVSPTTTSNGVFGCLYVIFPSLYSTCGILDVTAFPLISVMNFLNAKSKYCNFILS